MGIAHRDIPHLSHLGSTPLLVPTTSRLICLPPLPSLTVHTQILHYFCSKGINIGHEEGRLGPESVYGGHFTEKDSLELGRVRSSVGRRLST